jgi:CheY-like chemotaxis protein
MHKILVADDSLTIQKVIKITLANEGFELIECLKSDDIDSLLEAHSPEIVLLDYNLSEDKTGYELAADILEVNPSAQILMLFGTFDTIDESLMSQSGIKYKIVKPFDGTKFITLCNAMRGETNNSQVPDRITVEDNFESADEEEWVMDSPSSSLDIEDSIEDEASIIDEDKTAQIDLDSLQSSVEDWGMDVPGVIGRDVSDHMEIPGIIENDLSVEPLETISAIETAPTQAPTPLDDLVLPGDEDLEYPEIILESKPALVPLESLDDEEEIEIETSFVDTDINLEEEIEDEIDTDSLWSADEVEQGDDSFKPLAEDLPRIEPHKLVEVKEEVVDTSSNDSFDSMDFVGEAPDDFPADVMDEPSPKRSEPVLATESIENLVKEKMEPIIQDLVREYCQANIEKIAWEIIPDLAENLIRKEIEKITNSVLEP